MVAFCGASLTVKTHMSEKEAELWLLYLQQVNDKDLDYIIDKGAFCVIKSFGNWLYENGLISEVSEDKFRNNLKETQREGDSENTRT